MEMTPLDDFKLVYQIPHVRSMKRRVSSPLCSSVDGKTTEDYEEESIWGGNN